MHYLQLLSRIVDLVVYCCIALTICFYGESLMRQGRDDLTYFDFHLVLNELSMSEMISLASHALFRAPRPEFLSDTYLHSRRWFRLCTISRSRDGAIYLTIEKFRVDSAPPYRALSYTWGSPLGHCVSQRRCERPDDGSWVETSTSLGDLSIPVNLMMAVRQLAEQEQTDYYWIDAVCINQQDDRERSEQVSNMDKIYQQAITVDVWLGGADQHIRRIDAITRNLADLYENAQGFSYNTICPNDSEMTKYVKILSPPDQQALTELFSRRWFRRMWTMQDFALARELRVFSRDVMINPEVLYKAIRFLSDRFITIKLVYGTETLFTNTTSLLPFKLQQAVRGERLPDLELLDCYQGSNETQETTYEALLAWVFWHTMSTFATDPRDYVFGIVGVTNAIAVRLGLEYEPLLVDYSMDIVETFQAFTSRLMKSSFGLRAILLVRQNHIPIVQIGPPHKENTKGLPFWVPDLAARDWAALSMHNPYYNRAQPLCLHVKGFKKVARKRIPFHISGKTLHLSALYVGKVVDTTTIFPHIVNWYSNYLTALRLITLLRLLPSSYPGTGQTPFEALFHTLRVGNSDLFDADSYEVLPSTIIEKYLSRAVQLGIWLISQEKPEMKLEDIVPEFLDQLNANPWTIPEISTDFVTQNETITLIRDLRTEWQQKWSNHASDIHPELIERMQESYDSVYRAFGNQITSTGLFLVELAEEIAPPLQRDTKAPVLLLGLGPNTIRQGDGLWVTADHEWPLVLTKGGNDDDLLELLEGDHMLNLDYNKRRAFSQFLCSRLSLCIPLYGPALDEFQITQAEILSKSKKYEVTTKSNVSSQYRLRGEAYVHGIMHGELFKINEQEWDEIVLV